MLDAAQIASQKLIVRYSNTAAVTFLAWDHAVTFADEVEFIWKSKRSNIKWSFLLLRYFTLPVLILLQNGPHGIGLCRELGLCHASDCAIFFGFQLGSLQLIIMLQQYIMTIRVCAIWGQQRRITMALFAVFILQHILMIMFTILSFPNTTFDDTCTAIEAGPYATGIGLPPILYDSIILVLTYYRFMKSNTTTHSSTGSPFVRMILQDGAWSYALCLGVYMLDGTCFFFLEGPISPIIWLWQFSASSFSACRLVLHTYNNGSNTLSTHERTESSHAGRGEIWRRPRRHSRLSSTLDLYADVDVFGLSTFSPADLALDGLESPDSAGQPLDRLPSP